MTTASNRATKTLFQSRSVRGLFATVATCTAGFVFWHLGSQSLWIDELLTITPVIEADSIAGLIDGVVDSDTQPPASHFILYLLRDLLPVGDLGFRLPSFVYVTLGITIGSFAVRRLWGSATAVLFAALCGISPLLMFYAAEARNYGLWFLVSVSAFAVFARWLQSAGLGDAPPDGRAIRWGIALGVVNAVGIWTHLFHVFAVSAQMIATAVVLLDRRRRNPGEPVMDRLTARSTIIALTVTTVLFLPWFLVLLDEISRGEAGVPWTRPFHAMNLAYYCFAALFGMSWGPTLIDLHTKNFQTLVTENIVALVAAAALVVSIAITYVVVVSRVARDPEQRWQLLALVLIPITLCVPLVVYGVATHFPIHIRHFLYVWPALPLVLSIAALRTRYGGVVYTAAFALGLLSTVNLFTDPRYAKDDTRGAVAFAEANSAGKVMIVGEVVSYYCQHAECLPRHHYKIAPGTDHLWLLYNRGWTHDNQRMRDRLADVATAAGLEPREGNQSFRGIKLMHWSRNQP